jgi:hypothetical protein
VRFARARLLVFHNLSIKLNRPHSEALMAFKVNFIALVITFLRCSVENIEMVLFICNLVINFE